MRILKSYGEGIKQATLQPKMISVLWLINFIFGSVIFYLFYGAFSDFIGKTVVADRLVKKFDFNFLFEFLFHEGKATHIVFSAAFILVLIYFLVSIFLRGGILFTLTHPRKSGNTEKRKGGFAPIFFQGGGKFFGRFFRLLLYSLILWIAFVILNVLLTLLGGIFTAKGANEPAIFYIFWIRMAIGLFLVFLILMILDYTRIKIVTQDSRLVFRSLFETIVFVFQKFPKTLALYYLLVVSGILVFGIYWGLKTFIPTYSLFTILVAFIIGQLFIASRGWLRIAFQAAQLKFYSSERSQEGSQE